MDPNLKTYLEKHKISYKVHEHPAVFTVEQSEKEPAIVKIPGMRSKNLFLRDEHKSYYLVCMPGEKRLNIKSLKNKLEIKEIHFATPEELKKELNLTPGSVSIFGMIYTNNVKLIIDKDLWNAPIVGFHPNVNTVTLELKHEDLEKFYNILNIRKEVMELE